MKNKIVTHFYVKELRKDRNEEAYDNDFFTKASNSDSLVYS